MSKLLSLKMDDRVFSETERLLKTVRQPRNAYINRAVDFYNRLQKRRLVKRALKRDMELIRDDTREFVKAFELLEDLPE